MKLSNYLAVASVVGIAAGMSCAQDDTLAITNACRTFLGTSTVYRTGSTKSFAELPETLKASLMFAFDCMNTNGWEFNASGEVLKIPNLVSTGVHADRFLTIKTADVVDPYYFSAYKIYYKNASSCTAGAFVDRDPDGVLNGPYIDFGFVGSMKGLFFNAVEHSWSRTVKNTVHSGETANIMENIGTVVGVYKSNMGMDPVVNDSGKIQFKDGGGSVLAGGDFNRFMDYGIDDDGVDKNGSGLKRSVLVYNLKSAMKGGWAWTGLQKGASHTTYWTGGWQTFAATPVSATLVANGVGLGNVIYSDAVATSGGQSIAELLIFDRVLGDDETQEVLYYLEKKWLGKTYAGRDGNSEMTWLALRDSTEYAPASPVAVTFDVPEGESLKIGRVTGGRHSGTVPPQVIKTGAGEMTVADASDFGGEIAVRSGTLRLQALKRVPALEELPAFMMLRLDASDASTLDISDGRVSEWRNLAERAVREKVETTLVQEEGARRPVFIEDALGKGLNVLDFGRMDPDLGRYMLFAPARSYQTIAAVVDARMFGGGNLASTTFQRHKNEIPNSSRWREEDYHRLLCGRSLNISDHSGDMVPAKFGAAWVNGQQIDSMREGYDAPTWQVVVLRVPSSQALVRFLGAAGSINSSNPGGMRIGEVMAWNRPLSAEEAVDVSAYLMKKWLGRTPVGYDDGSGIPQVQTVRIGGEGAAVDVPGGGSAKIGNLVTDGMAVKTGKGTLVLCGSGDISSGLEIQAGRIKIGDGSDVETACEVAVNPSLRLDASDSNTLAFVEYDTKNEDGTPKYGTTNFVWSWQDRSGRIAALISDETLPKRIRPFLNTDASELCNGLPTVDFGECVPGWSNNSTPGRYLPLSRTLFNVRSVYMVLGSQAGGGQPLGGRNFECIDRTSKSLKDFVRVGDLEPDAGDPLFKDSGANIKNGELWINGARQESVTAWIPSGGYDLVELHVEKGVAFNALGTGFDSYIHGGCRIGELIVFERPLSDREKTATRNYLMHKWFDFDDNDLTPLPEKAALPAVLSGDMTFASDSVLELEVENSAVVAPVAVSGRLEFKKGARISVKGFDSAISAGDRLLIGVAGECHGYEDIVFDFDREFEDSHQPTAAFIGGKLYAVFGCRGFAVILR